MFGVLPPGVRISESYSDFTQPTLLRPGPVSCWPATLGSIAASVINNNQEPGREGAGLLPGLVTALQAGGVVCDTISLGDTKFMGVCRAEPAGLARRLDIRLLPRNEFYCGVLYFTGSMISHNYVSIYLVFSPPLT